MLDSASAGRQTDGVWEVGQYNTKLAASNAWQYAGLATSATGTQNITKHVAACTMVAAGTAHQVR